MLREIVSYTVPPEHEGKLVKDLIRNQLAISRGLLRKVVGAGGVLVNGSPVYITSRVKDGDLLQLMLLPEQSEEILPEPIPFVIMHEDQDVLVVSKPAGMVVHPTKGHYTGTLANGVVYYWQKNGESARFRPVHRIDRNTSGLLIIAKDHYSHQRLSDQLKKRTLKREYTAVVHGVLADNSGTICEPIAVDPDGGIVRLIRSEGKQAVTHFSVVERLVNATLLRLRLETGRTHQIRVHMKHIGHPLFGDDLYGLQEPDGMERQALHAEALGFIHPRTNLWMEWKATLPEDMNHLLLKLRNRKPY